MRKTVPALIVAVSTCGPAVADGPMVVPLQRLSMDAAVKIAQGAIEVMSRQGTQIAVTVVDREGTVQVTLRDTIAAPTPIGRVERLVMSAGGVPVLVGGSSLVAGVGVGGAPSGATDEECAVAGIAEIQDDLDMAMSS
jgi:uncharacterized protein GlcG (DUF336 family)